MRRERVRPTSIRNVLVGEIGHKRRIVLRARTRGGQVAIGVSTEDSRQILAQVIGVQVLKAILQAVVPLHLVDRVRDLPATLIRIRRPIQKRRRAELERIGNAHIRWNLIGVRVPLRWPRRNVIQHRVLVRGGHLVVLVLEVTPVLVAQLVAQRIRQHCIQLHNAEGVLHEIVAIARHAVTLRGARLNARR